MEEKAVQELLLLKMSVDAMRQQVIENFDAMAERIESLLPEDKTLRRQINGDPKEYWKEKCKTW